MGRRGFKSIHVAFLVVKIILVSVIREACLISYSLSYSKADVKHVLLIFLFRFVTV